MNVDSQYSGPLNKKYFDVLHCVYKASELNRTTKNISLGDIANSLYVPGDQIIRIAKYLSTKDFIKKDNPLDVIDCHAWITPKGIAEVEKIASTNKPKNQVDQALNVSPNHPFIDEGRLQELKEISSKNSKFDFSKLIKLCEELNSNYSNGNYSATAMLTRAIMDHVPPIFGKDTFTEVVNNCSGSKSFKKSMKNLDDFQRNISDGILHEQIRDSESLPNKTQVNCSQALDTLLGEIVRILKKSES
jgi:DNA-binding MarR family transcriptional regulator